MRYPAQTVDGRVHMEGGNEIREALLRACPAGSLSTGESVITPATRRLQTDCGYNFIIHTVPPLAGDRHNSCSSQQLMTGANKLQLLLSCYASTLAIIHSTPGINYAALPLVGAGTAGFSVGEVSDCIKHALSMAHTDTTTVAAAKEEHGTAPDSNKTIRVVAKTLNNAEQIIESITSCSTS